MTWATLLKRALGRGCPAMLAGITLAATSFAQSPQEPRNQLQEPVYRVAKQPEGQPVSSPAPTQPQGHPLIPAIQMADKALGEIDANVKDYTCTLVKRELIDGTVTEHEYIFLKVRHQPFSVYMYFLGPKEIKGRECIYVTGANEGRMVAHEGGVKGKLLGTHDLDPTGFIAMRGQRYPITEIGVRNLTTKLLEVARSDVNFGECDVKFFKDAKVNGRTCTGLQVSHPVRRDNFRFHIAQVFIDDELQLPIRYASYDWPTAPGQAPQLLEEYTYLNMKVNVGLTDADFDRANKDYGF